jgi:hypothetical protein
MINSITSGNLDVNSLSAGDQAQLAKLEAQAGLPVGFTSSLQLSAKDRVLTTSTSDGVTSVVMMDPSGNITVKKIQTGSSSGSTQSADLDALEKDILNKASLDQLFELWGSKIAPNTIYEKYNELSPWGTANESLEDLKNKYNITSGESSSGSTEANITKAKQLILGNGGTDDDLKRAETDTEFVNWVIVKYGG